ncbi:MAG: hypothetical protein EBX41_01820 [Chitinophagia bacterium]|nr:hypothetical protein [Chitinophagia bacterium]
MTKTWHILLWLCLAGGQLLAQSSHTYPAKDTTDSAFQHAIALDIVVVKAGFDMNKFIQRIKNDTSFYKAFKSMHLVPFTARVAIKAQDKEGTAKASLNATLLQIRTANCRKDSTLSQHAEGRFFKADSSFVYYSAEMFYSLFFSEKKVCNETDLVGNSQTYKGEGRMEQHKYALKQLIFNPGAKVKGIPLMGDKASLFDEDELHKYNLSVKRVEYDSISCYLFTVVPKPEYSRKVVYNELSTWFSLPDYRILARRYALSFRTVLYDFDVNMDVRTRLINGKIYPSYIKYGGNWHVATQKRERTDVELWVTY